MGCWEFEFTFGCQCVIFRQNINRSFYFAKGSIRLLLHHDQTSQEYGGQNSGHGNAIAIVNGLVTR